MVLLLGTVRVEITHTPDLIPSHSHTQRSIMPIHRRGWSSSDEEEDWDFCTTCHLRYHKCNCIRCDCGHYVGEDEAYCSGCYYEDEHGDMHRWRERSPSPPPPPKKDPMVERFDTFVEAKGLQFEKSPERPSHLRSVSSPSVLWEETLKLEAGREAIAQRSTVDQPKNPVVPHREPEPTLRSEPKIIGTLNVRGRGVHHRGWRG